jgi:gamma-glutamyl-gamma-aminobutyrate hydrolase PuuD
MCNAVTNLKGASINPSPVVPPTLVAPPINSIAIPQSSMSCSVLITPTITYEGLGQGLVNWCREKEGDDEHENRVLAAQRIMRSEKEKSITLNLANLGLTSLPPILGTLTHLRSLHLNGNLLTNIAILEHLTGLTSLFLHMNRIAEIGPLGALRELRTLGLAGNLVSDLAPLSGLFGLRHLYLGGNKISNVKPLSELVGLTTLNLSSNPLADINKLAKLSNLQVLDVSQTQLDSIPFLFAYLEKGATINAENTLLSAETVRAFSENIRKASEDSTQYGPTFTPPFFKGSLVRPYNIIEKHFPGCPAPLIARPVHASSGYLGQKISMLLEKLGAIPKQVDVNFLDLDPHLLMKEVHRGIQTIRDFRVPASSIPGALMRLAKENPESYATIRKIQLVAKEAMSQCRGLALPGGVDIEEEFYSEGAKLSQVDYRRSIAEFAFVDVAHQQKKPILGTCRGAQLMNVYFGGTLKNIDRQIDWQTVDVIESSKQGLLQRLFKGNSIIGYFFHHQACGKIAPGFEVVMKRGDIPEMIMSEDNEFIGMQIHPEQDRDGKYSNGIRVYRLFLDKVMKHSLKT